MAVAAAAGRTAMPNRAPRFAPARAASHPLAKPACRLGATPSQGDQHRRGGAHQGERADPPSLLLPVHEIAPLTLRLVATAPVSRLWNEYIQRYHYLGYSAMSGSQLRYNVYAGDQLVALLSFGASAWKLAARDSFIGWQSAQRLKNLHLVVNNARFLILPWIQCKGLASKILSIVNRQLPHHWQQRYGFKPVLLETFVECERHRGTSYKAANWVHVGKTVGRGKKSRVHAQIIPIKDIWLYPLRQNFRAALCA